MKDNFSKQADIYARYRPRYPRQLFDFIIQNTPGKQNAWDCATGNGQSAIVLASYFEKVFATDISQRQIENAVQAENISYSVQLSEHTSFKENTFDLITVSQALHWFATDEFYNEVRRVARPLCIFAAWSYSLLNVSPKIDRIIRSFYTNVIGTYWDAERRYVDEEYKTIHFPFEEIAAPDFNMEYSWTLEEMQGYVNTWSAVQKFIAANSTNPVGRLIEDIRPYWYERTMKVNFPLHLRIGLIGK